MCKLGYEWGLDQTKSKRNRQVSCVYVVGIAGLANPLTHYSVMVKLNQKVDHTVLKEGMPVNEEILELEPKYFLVSLHDPSIKKFTIQMTTIHGDPDLYLSKSTKEPNQNNFE